MERFAEEMTRDPLWPKLCRREGDGNKTVPVDAWGCTEQSFFNLTRFNKFAKESHNLTQMLTGIQVDEHMHLQELIAENAPKLIE